MNVIPLLILAVIAIIIFLTYVHFENVNLEVTYYTIHSKKVPSGFQGSRFVVLADLHNNSFGVDNVKLINKISKIKPDFILIAGDMIIGKEDIECNAALVLLKQLSKKYPIYYGYGNHEQRVMPGGKYHSKHFDEYKVTLQKLGIHFLENETTYIARNGDKISITGLKIGLEYFKKLERPVMESDYLQNLVGINKNQCYNIMIAHNPLYFREYAEYGADLVVSGHLHGGMVRLPVLGGIVSPQYRLLPKYDAGRFDQDNKTMLVSKGLGMHTIKLRVFNRPELMVITLDK